MRGSHFIILSLTIMTLFMFFFFSISPVMISYNTLFCMVFSVFSP